MVHAGSPESLFGSRQGVVLLQPSYWRARPRAIAALHDDDYDGRDLRVKCGPRPCVQSLTWAIP